MAEPAPHSERPAAPSSPEPPGDAAAVTSAAAAAAVLPTFHPARFLWRRQMDIAIRNGLLVGALLAMAVAVVSPLATNPATVLTFVLGGGWVWLGIEGTRVARQLPASMAAMDHEPTAGALRLGRWIKQRFLPPWVRLMLWQQVAALHHRQQRYGEAAVIAQHLLGVSPAGAFAQSRSMLLLMLLDCQLELRDVWGAWATLRELSHRSVSLNEAIQRMVLRTRYELMIGRADQVLILAGEKQRLSELLPAGQCGAFHALLASAAEQAGQAQAAAGWWQRVELLCPPAQVERLRVTTSR